MNSFHQRKKKGGKQQWLLWLLASFVLRICFLSIFYWRFSDEDGPVPTVSPAIRRHRCRLPRSLPRLSADDSRYFSPPSNLSDLYSMIGWNNEPFVERSLSAISQ